MSKHTKESRSKKADEEEINFIETSEHEYDEYEKVSHEEEASVKTEKKKKHKKKDKSDDEVSVKSEKKKKHKKKDKSDDEDSVKSEKKKKKKDKSDDEDSVKSEKKKKHKKKDKSDDESSKSKKKHGFKYDPDEKSDEDEEKEEKSVVKSININSLLRDKNSVKSNFSSGISYKSDEPYSVYKFNVDGKEFVIYDVSSTSLILVCRGELYDEDGKDGFKISGGKRIYKSDKKFFCGNNLYTNGYVFFKNNKEYIDVLDKIVGSEKWKDGLRKELKIVDTSDKVEPVLLWEGEYDDVECRLYEYSVKSLAFVSPIEHSIFKGQKKLNFKLNDRVEQCYYIAKASSSKLNDIIDENFGENYIYSTPVMAVKTSSKKETKIASKTVQLVIDGEEIEVKVKVYEGDKRFVFSTNDDEIDFVDLGFDEIKGEENKYYIIKGDKAKLKLFKKVFKFELVESPKVKEDEKLSSIIPKKEEANLSKTMLELLKLRSTFKESVNKTIGNKLIRIIKKSETKNFEDEENELLMSGKFIDEDEDILFFVYRVIT